MLFLAFFRRRCSEVFRFCAPPAGGPFKWEQWTTRLLLAVLSNFDADNVNFVGNCFSFAKA